MRVFFGGLTLLSSNEELFDVARFFPGREGPLSVGVEGLLMLGSSEEPPSGSERKSEKSPSLLGK